jgi:subfamily B ATP-binding cassette protein MsbA
VSAVRSADQILVVENGAVVDRGTHAELAAHEGYYADLFRLQSLEAAEEAAMNGDTA